ncbi:MAG: DUF177 domain-containing protein [Gemmatimonadota bacterium]
MLTIPLVRLAREGSLEFQAEIPSDDPSWEGTELRFSAPLSVFGHVQWIPSGEVLARIRLQGLMAQECRRCLEPLTVPVEEELDLLFAPVDESTEIDEDSVRPLPERVGELNLADVIREEVLLSVSPLALCKPDCKGLCPQCGINLNENRCECSQEESDPRWEALRALNEERE